MHENKKKGIKAKIKKKLQVRGAMTKTGKKEKLKETAR